MNLTPEEVHKMKVVELRAELANRGLDSKGVKAVLAERLIAALDRDPSALATNLGNGNTKAEVSVQDGSHQEDEAEKVGKGGEQEDEEEKDNGDVQLTAEEEEKLLAGNGDDEAGGEDEEEDQEEEAPEEENLGDEETDEGTGEELKDEDESAGQVKDDKAEAEKMESEEAKSDEKVEVAKDEKAEVSKDEKAEDESKDDEAEGSKEVAESKKTDGAEDESMEVDQESNKRKIDEVQGENEEEKEEKPEKKRQRTEEIKVIAEHEPEFDEEQVLLDWYKSDLNLKISEENYLEATPWNIEEFPFAYAGVKGTYGFQSGKVYYEATWEESAEIKLDFGEEEKKYLLRVGWSDLSAGLQLGQDKLSYGLDSSGKVYKGGVAEDSDVTFEKGDVIGTILDLDSDPVQIKFTKNGEIVGPTIEIPREELAEKTLFPHILTRNVKFVVNFGEAETKYTPEEGVILASKVEADKRVRGPTRGAARTDCEFVMLVGLAGCGKTKWAKDYVEANVDKHYNILGTSTLVERSLQDQKILGSSSTSRTYDGFFQKAGKFVEKLVEIAPSRRRNFILDQSNVVPGAQRRKSSGFQGFIRRAVVIVPSDEEYQNRIKSKEQEQGKSVPKSTILDMKAGFRLPDVGEIFTAVDFADLDREEAQKLISKYNKEGQAAGYGRPIQTRGGGMRAGRGRGRGGPRGSYNRGGGGGGWRGGPMGGGGGGRPYGGPPRGGGGGPRGMGPMRGGPRGGGPRGGGGGGGGLPRGASRGGSLPRFQRGGPPRGGGGGGGSWRGDSVPMRSSGPPLRGAKRDFGGGRGGGGGSWRGGNGNVVQGGGRGGYGGGGGGPRNPQQQGFQNWGQSWGPPGRSTAGGGFGGGFAGSGGDPWQQVPDQGFGQSWDSSAGGRSGGGGGGGTWQNYGGQTFGGNYGNRR